MIFNILKSTITYNCLNAHLTIISIEQKETKEVNIENFAMSEGKTKKKMILKKVTGHNYFEY